MNKLHKDIIIAGSFLSAMISFVPKLAPFATIFAALVNFYWAEIS